MPETWLIDAIDRLAPDTPTPVGADPDAYAVHGRCMMADGEELSCRAIKVSTTHAAIVGARRMDAGEIVVCYLDNIGMVRGRVSRPLRDGFILAFDVSTTRKREVETALSWHSGEAQKAAEQRAAPRIVPVSRVVDVRLGEGIVFRGIVINVSISGAAIALQPANVPFNGALVRVGSKLSRVVRLIERGVAVQFNEAFDPATFDHHVVL